MNKITEDEFKLISLYIYNLTGISLTDDKKYLIENRFNKLCNELKCSSFSEFYNKIKNNTDVKIKEKIINAITTNETLFFRDNSPFELLKHKIIPDIIDRKMKENNGMGPIKIKVWSAACSTGQEVYSIAMILDELLGDFSKYDISIIGTDISDEAVSRASLGFFNKFEIGRGLPNNYLQKYFTPQGDNWKIIDRIRAMASFKKFNLMDSFMLLGKFDIILCRNVAIYFNIEDRKNLYNRMIKNMDKDGVLIIGSSESLSNICPALKPKRYIRSIYYEL